MSNTALLLINLGSPNYYDTNSVKKYLSEFLMDKYVIQLPYLLRYLLVNGFIVPFRSSSSSKKYEQIWTKHGSPLTSLTADLKNRLQETMDMPVEFCMRYGNPTPEDVLEKIQQNPEIKKIAILPLYPHYASSSYQTAVDHVMDAYMKKKYSFVMTIIPPFYDDEYYINALAHSIKPYIEQEYDYILFSYHGLPEKHITKLDASGHCLTHSNCCTTLSSAHIACYRHQIIATTNAVTQKLNIPSSKFSFSFQSRLGSNKWLKPYTSSLLEEFPKNGIKKILVVCPAFVTDCLETIFEMNVEGKEIFMQAGGTSFTLIPALNTNHEWTECINHLYQSYALG